MSEPSSAACLRRVLAELRVGEVLDVGCGSGSFTRTLADVLGGFRSILGIDPDKDSVDEARRLTDDRRIRYRVLAAGRAPLGDDRFDLVAISNALHHLDDPARTLAGACRSARPGAYLIVQELVSDDVSPAERNGRDVHHFKARIDRLHGRSHEQTLTRSEVRSLVESTGATVEDECEVVDPAAESGEAAADRERVDEAIAFLAEYLLFAEGRAGYDELAREARRLTAELPVYGIATPPRLLIRARLPRPSRRSAPRPG